MSDTVKLPVLPPGADAGMVLKRDLAIAAIAFKDKITLQAAADKMASLLGAVDDVIASHRDLATAAARATPTVRIRPSADSAPLPPPVRGQTVGGPSQGEIER